ncbi:MAG: beta-galactosidase [Anaerolineae bacterium]|nr:beta-galactosidase [Anaerolineae bacterium]
MELTYGGLPADRAEARALLDRCRDIGVTSFETYISWAEVEPAPGQFHWERYDEEVALLGEYGIRWVPFVILGPWYLTPAWFRDSPEHLPYRCLEHDRDNGVQSLWNPALPAHIQRFMAAFATHYLPMDVLESVLLGITGDYGEAIYPAVGNWPKDYHTHPGYWCGDRMAVADFRAHLQAKYQTLPELNACWGTRYAAWEEVRPFLRAEAGSARAWLDQMAWYRGAMSAWADRWMGWAVEAFPGVPIYLCTGGDGTPAHGSDFAAQCQIAAKHGGGVRITNEGSDYLFNLTITRLVASAGRHYGAFFGFEPASFVDERGAVARIYNAVASGARQLHDYVGNTWRDGAPVPAAAAAFDANRHHLTARQPQVEVAVLLPLDDFTLQEVGFSERMVRSLRLMRDIADFDFVDERLIRDGALAHYRFLVALDGLVLARDVQEAIAAWVEAGGVVVSWQLWQDLDRRDDVARALFGLTAASDRRTGIQQLELLAPDLLRALSEAPYPVTVFSYWPLAETAQPLAVTRPAETPVIWLNRHGRGYAVFYSGPKENDLDLSFAWMGDQHLYMRLVRDVLYHLPALIPDAPALETVTGAGDGVYVTRLADGGYLCLNFASAPRALQVGEAARTLAPYSIAGLPGGQGQQA